MAKQFYEVRGYDVYRNNVFFCQAKDGEELVVTLNQALSDLEQRRDESRKLEQVRDIVCDHNGDE